MKQDKLRVNSLQQLRELYGRSDLSKAVKPGHDPKGIRPKEIPQNQPRREEDE